MNHWQQFLQMYLVNGLFLFYTLLRLHLGREKADLNIFIYQGKDSDIVW